MLVECVWGYAQGTLFLCTVSIWLLCVAMVVGFCLVHSLLFIGKSELTANSKVVIYTWMRFNLHACVTVCERNFEGVCKNTFKIHSK